MISYGEAKYLVALTYFYIGQDLLVVITGGDEHIGGVSLIENGSFSSIAKKGHKDDVISNMVAPLIYDELKKDTLVICGIHLDNATKEEIDIMVNNAQKCVEEFLLIECASVRKAIDE